MTNEQNNVMSELNSRMRVINNENASFIAQKTIDELSTHSELRNQIIMVWAQQLARRTEDQVIPMFKYAKKLCKYANNDFLQAFETTFFASASFYQKQTMTSENKDKLQKAIFKTSRRILIGDSRTTTTKPSVVVPSSIVITTPPEVAQTSATISRPFLTLIKRVSPPRNLQQGVVIGSDAHHQITTSVQNSTPIQQTTTITTTPEQKRKPIKQNRIWRPEHSVALTRWFNRYPSIAKDFFQSSDMMNMFLSGNVFKNPMNIDVLYRNRTCKAAKTYFDGLNTTVTATIVNSSNNNDKTTSSRGKRGHPEKEQTSKKQKK